MKIVTLALLATLACGTYAQPAKPADPAKVLRTAIIVAETGFDPQAAQDLYSNTINSPASTGPVNAAGSRTS